MVNPARYGVSLSVKQCRSFKLDWHDCLDWALHGAGFRRFRLMSYWNEIEKEQSIYDFTVLDEQIERISKVGGVITLCLGVKQPRWPEYHWPNWTKDLEIRQKNKALLKFVKKVVTRYRNEKSIISWQLENEALLKHFGDEIAIDRHRLLREFALIKQLDPQRPVIMSTSNNWGIPVRQPIPDIVGFSYYAVVYNDYAGYTRTEHRPWLHKIRKYLICQLLNRPVFMHELQLEPWGPEAIWRMSASEQNKSMSTTQITQNLRDAQKICAYPIDMWGLEWWYWRHIQGDNTIWHAVKDGL